MTNSGIRFHEEMAGWIAVPQSDFGDSERAWLRLRADVVIDDLDAFLADPNHRGHLVGEIDFGPVGQAVPASGHVELFAVAADSGIRLMRYQASFSAGGIGYKMIGTKHVTKSAGFNIWGHTTTLFTTVTRHGPDGDVAIAGGIIRLSMWQGTRLMTTLRGTGAGGMAARMRAVLRFMQFFTQEVAAAYLPGRATARPKP